MTTHSRSLAREIPGTEEPRRLRSMGSQRDTTQLTYRHTYTHTHTHIHTHNKDNNHKSEVQRAIFLILNIGPLTNVLNQTRV